MVRPRNVGKVHFIARVDVGGERLAIYIAQMVPYRRNQGNLDIGPALLGEQRLEKVEWLHERAFASMSDLGRAHARLAWPIALFKKSSYVRHVRPEDIYGRIVDFCKTFEFLVEGAPKDRASALNEVSQALSVRWSIQYIPVLAISNGPEPKIDLSLYDFPDCFVFSGDQFGRGILLGFVVGTHT